MKIEAGKYYRTRFGSKAYVADVYKDQFIDGNLTDRNDAIGWVFYEDKTVTHECWGQGGCYFPDRRESGYDLVSEWVEEEKPHPLQEDIDRLKATIERLERQINDN